MTEQKARAPQAELSSSDVLERFVAWGEARDDVRAAVVIGSRAATNVFPDRWSDTDIVVVATRPDRLLRDSTWLTELGAPRLSCVASVEGEAFVAVWFDGEVKFDFIVISRAHARAASILLRLTVRLPACKRFVPSGARRQIDGFANTVGKGMRVLFDKDGSATALAGVPISRPSRPLPNEVEFRNAVRTFLSWSLWTAKILARGELWRSKHSCDHEMKQMLLQLIEWHARAACAAKETWYLGRFLENWADPRAVTALRGCFAHYDGQEVLRALRTTVATYVWLARETAERLGFVYPSDEEDWVLGRLDAHSHAESGRALAGSEMVERTT